MFENLSIIKELTACLIINYIYFILFFLLVKLDDFLTICLIKLAFIKIFILIFFFLLKIIIIFYHYEIFFFILELLLNFQEYFKIFILLNLIFLLLF